MNGVINHLYNNKKINLDMLEGYKRGCKNFCVYGKQVFLIRIRYVIFCCRFYDFFIVDSFS